MAVHHLLLLFALLTSAYAQSAPPAGAVRLGTFVTRAHELQGEVFAVDQRTFFIRNLIYDGTGPAAFFWVGEGTRPSANGNAVPHVPDCGSMKLPRYERDTVTVELPEGLTINDIGYLSVWCEAAVQNFGEVLITDAQKAQIPAATGPAECAAGGTFPVPEGWACSQLTAFYQVRWQRAGNNMNIELVAKATADQWVSFGVSGVQTGTTMDNSDMVIATEQNGEVSIVDYFTNGREQCVLSEGRGVCPDSTQGGTNHITGVDGERQLDTVRYRYTRPIAASDAQDRAIIVTPSTNTFVVWAIGPYNRDSNIPQIHRTGEFTLPRQDVTVMFSSTENKCMTPITAMEPVEEKVVEPFKRPTISNVTDFTMRIGPSGGDRGVRAITQGSSWGIAWWVSPSDKPETDVLIPAIAVERGKTYTFRVFGGKDETKAFHPLYITSDSDGGLATKNPASRARETIFAGVDVSSAANNETGIFEFTSLAKGPLCEYTNTEDQNKVADYNGLLGQLNRSCKTTVASNDAGVLEFTVPQNLTEDVLYYQCVTHRDLGYKLVVFDEGKVDQKRLEAESVVARAEAGGSQTCRATFKGEELTFRGCSDVATNFRVLWNVVGSNIETMFVAKAEGWVGLGWGHQSMVPGDAVIAYKRGDAVEVSEFALTQRASSGVNPKPTQVITGTDAEVQGENIAARFTRPLAVGDNVLSADADANLIWAMGPASPNAPVLNNHGPGSRGTKTVNLASGAASGGSSTRTLFIAHGFMMAISWALLSPFAVVLMRFFKKLNPTTFQLHRGLNGLAVLAGLIAFIMAIVRGSKTQIAHLAIGVVVTALSLIQAVGGALRPHKGTPARKPWFIGHAWAGRAALSLAWVNIFIGLNIFEAGLGWIIAAAVVMGIFVAASIALSFLPGQFPITEDDGIGEEPGEEKVPDVTT